MHAPALRGFMRKVRWNDGLGITLCLKPTLRKNVLGGKQAI
jgi:hypothetical protein